MNIILIGPPGVGKGTAAKLIQNRFDIEHISTGDIFREMFDKNNELARLAKEYINDGNLVPDNITNALVEETLQNKKISRGLLFDGYPRNIIQAKAFEKMLSNRKIKIHSILMIDADEKIIASRVEGRRVCKKCKRVYHIKFRPPIKFGICDVCGDKLYQRKDDMKKTILKRLEVFKSVTSPMIKYYEKFNTYTLIDGSGSIENTHNQILEVLEKSNDFN